MADQQRYPLSWPDGWPRAKHRKAAAFGKKNVNGYGRVELTLSEAVKRVHDEIARLGVRISDDCIISTNIKVNLSGLPRSGERLPTDPGVAVYWQEKGKPMRVIAVDAYTTVPDNLAAIAATLNAMRAIERHGGAQIQERAFTGFDALPPPPSCWQILGLAPQGKTTEARNNIIAAHREKVREAATDPLNGGERMAAVNAARDDALKLIGE
jgi:hypothetical protein